MAFPKPMDLLDTVFESSYLPAEVWDEGKQIDISPLAGHDFNLKRTSELFYLYDDSTQVPRNIMDTLQALTLKQTLSLAVLLRTRRGITAMVSIGEAMKVVLGERHLQFMLILLQIIEHSVGLSYDESKQRNYDIEYQVKISHAQYLEDQLQSSAPRRIYRSSVPHLDDYSSVPRLDDNRPAKRSSFLHDTTEVREQQVELAKQLTRIQNQNQAILDLLQGQQAQQAQQAQQLTTIQSQNQEILRLLPEQLHPTVERAPREYHRPKSCRVLVCYMHRGLQLSYDTDIGKTVVVLLNWLHLLLGGTDDVLLETPLRCIRLADENKVFQQNFGREITVEQTHKQCWRKKVISGNIVMVLESSIDGSIATPQVQPSDEVHDGLHLTAAALWSLFDNALTRLPNCLCTFKSEGNDYVQCKARSGKWLLWHTFTDGDLCNGSFCAQNIAVALCDDDEGERLVTSSPCILGWVASGRNQANDIVWQRLSPTKNFKEKVLERYSITELQATAQLSVPALISPQFGGHVTFTKRNYKVANSLDEDTELALATAAVAIVLVYDESRNLYLTMDGADIIEMICVGALRNAACDTTSLPPLTHLTALDRLEQWRHSSFTTLSRINITGDQLVRQVAKRIIKLLEATRNAHTQDSKTLYWVLEDVVKGQTSIAVKAPVHEQVSWHQLALATPPLIFAVGEVETRFLAKTDSAWTWKPQTRRRHLDNIQWLFKKNLKLGGILASEEILRRWIGQAMPDSLLCLEKTGDTITYGIQNTDNENTYKIKKSEKPIETAFGCACAPEETERCLHYIQ